MGRPSKYLLKDGTQVTGVTTIIGRFKESGGLLQWAFQQGKAAERGEINSLYDKRDEAASIGTAAHAAVEAYIKGKDPDQAIRHLLPITDQEKLESAYQSAWQAFQSYLNWTQQTRLKIVEQETPLVSEKYRYGGTLDAIGEIDGKLVMLDWKTSARIYQDYLIQLAAYNQLWVENTGKVLHGFHLCKFSKDYGDFSHHYFSDLNDAWEQFLLFRKAYDLDKILKKRAA